MLEQNLAMLDEKKPSLVVSQKEEEDVKSTASLSSRVTKAVQGTDTLLASDTPSVMDLNHQVDKLNMEREQLMMFKRRGLMPDDEFEANSEALNASIKKLEGKLESVTPKTDTPKKDLPIINEEDARRSKENMSFSSYKKGSATAEYESMVEQATQQAEKIKESLSTEGKAKVDKALERYKVQMANWINKRNASGAKHVSWAIAGPSKYNMRAHDKWVAKEGKLWEEYNEISDFAGKLQTIATSDKAIRSGQSDTLDKLKEKLARAEEEHQRYKDHNKKARAEGTETLPSYVLSNSNQRLKNLRDRIVREEKLAKQVEQAKAEGKQGQEKTINGHRIVDNLEANRLQIYFSGKPSASVRDELKRSGYRWAPSIGAWQRYRNPSAFSSAEKIVEKA